MRIYEGEIINIKNKIHNQMNILTEYTYAGLLRS